MAIADRGYVVWIRGSSTPSLGRTVRQSALPTLLVTTLIAGCVPYPVYKTLQPAAKATIRDDRGVPASGAVVTLVASAYPYGREKSRDTRTTTDDGVASRRSKHVANGERKFSPFTDGKSISGTGAFRKKASRLSALLTEARQILRSNPSSFSRQANQSRVLKGFASAA